MSDGEILRTIEGLEGFRVMRLAISSDGRLVSAVLYSQRESSASGSLWLLRVWQISDGKLLYTLYEAEGWQGIRDLAFSPDNRLIAATSNSGYLFIYQLSDGHRIFAIRPSGIGLSFSQDGQLLTNNNGTVSVSNGELVAEGYPVPDPRKSAYSAAMSPDHRYFAIGTERRRYWATSDSPCGTAPCYRDDNGAWIWIYDASTRKVLHTLTGHTLDVTDLAFSPDSSLLASASADGTLKLWRVSDGVLLSTITISEIRIKVYECTFGCGSYSYSDFQLDVAFSPSGRLIITNVPDSLFQIINATPNDPPEVRFWGVPQ